jgi:hypothetical protein
MNHPLLFQITLAFFDNDILKAAGDMLFTKKRYNFVDKYGISFRLRLVQNIFVNFEVYVLPPKYYVDSYFKPIGYFDMGLNRYILKEFESTYEFLVLSEGISNDKTINKLTLQENAVIAAFSKETSLVAFSILDKFFKKGFIDNNNQVTRAALDSELIVELGVSVPYYVGSDEDIVINGLDSELLMCMDGFPQFFLNDKYNIKGPIAAYFLRQGKLHINPIIGFKALYDSLYQRMLLSYY